METFFIMMIAGGSVFVLFGLIAIINFGLIFKRGLDFDFSGMGWRVMIHMGAPFLAGLGGLSLIAGFIWFLIDKYAG